MIFYFILNVTRGRELFLEFHLSLHQCHPMHIYLEASPIGFKEICSQGGVPKTAALILLVTHGK